MGALPIIIFFDKIGEKNKNYGRLAHIFFFNWRLKKSNGMNRDRRTPV